jgi:SAM-dependent methyltransferase
MTEAFLYDYYSCAPLTVISRGMLLEVLSDTSRSRLDDDSVRMLERLIGIVAPTEGPRLIEAALSRKRERYGAANLFRGVVPDREGGAIHAARMRRFEALRGKNARYLELGAHDAWPDETVQRLLRNPDGEGFSELIRLDYDETCPVDLVASCYEIPLADGAVDYIRSNSLLEHVKDTLGTLRENFRVLSPGGYMEHAMPMFFVVHGYPKDYSRLSPDYFQDWMTEIGFTDIVVDTTPNAGRIYTSLTAMNSFEPSGLTMEQTALVEFIKTALLALSELDYADSGRMLFAHSIHISGRKPGTLAAREAERSAQGALILDGTAIERIADSVVHPVSKAPLTLHDGCFAGPTGLFPVKGASAHLRAGDELAA